MILHGDVGIRIEPVHAVGQVMRKHQEPDVVEEGCEFQIVQFACRQADSLSDQQ